jgi:hypothetical protein
LVCSAVLLALAALISVHEYEEKVLKKTGKEGLRRYRLRWIREKRRHDTCPMDKKKRGDKAG